MFCVFARQSDGRWKCPDCGYVSRSTADKPPRSMCGPRPPKSYPKHGPGTELKKLLDWWRIHDDGKCGCERLAGEMDVRGPAWCEANRDTILDHMAAAANERGLPFVRSAAAALVAEAIRRSRI